MANAAATIAWQPRTFAFTADDDAATLQFRCLQNANLHFASSDGVGRGQVIPAAVTTWPASGARSRIEGATALAHGTAKAMQSRTAVPACRRSSVPAPLVRLVVALALAAAFAVPSWAQSDGVLDTAHVSHVPWQDRRPLCPVDQQAFTVRLRAPRGDVAAVRVRLAGEGGAWVNASRAGARGAYDLWEASLPAGAGSLVRYYFEIADGPARAWVGPAGVAGAPPADSGFTVDFATLAHAPHGATPLPSGGVVFRVWAPGATTAAVRGEFNGWGQTPMQRLGEDFVARVPNAVVNQQYKYFFGGSTWAADPRGRVLDPASFLWNSRVADPTSFVWTDTAWRTPPLEQMVVYQLNTGTFCGLNDPRGATVFPSRFTDVAARAGELRALGVNAVMLNPVTSTPILTYAGYSTLTPWSPQFEYGSPDDFKALVDAFHREGIAVLCDIVWNHVDPGTALLWNYDGTQIYFESPATNTPWGPQAAFGRAGVDDFYLHSALHWLEEYHVDGFRMDAAAYMAVNPHAPAGWALMQRFNREVERRHHGAVRIAEYLPPRGAVVLPEALGGAGFDATYNGDWRTTLRFSIPQASGFYYTGYASNLRTVWPGLSSGRQSFNYFELHDEAWGPAGHRFSKDVAPTPGVIGDTAASRMRVAMGLLLLTPGVPAFLMGNEWLETADFGTSPAERIDWSRRTSQAGQYRFVRDLVDLRRHVPAFGADAASVPTHTNTDDGVFGWIRYDGQGRLYFVVANLGDEDFPSYLIGAPLAGEWLERLDSQDLGYGGTGMVNPEPLTAFAREQDGYPHTLDIRLPRSSVLVLQSLATVSAPEVEASLPLRMEPVWPNPAREAMHVRWAQPRSAFLDVSVFDVQGRRVAQLARGEHGAGAHATTWDGRDAAGRPAAPGVYLVRLHSASGHASRRVVRVH